MPLKSPLRYAGGKSRAVKQLSPYIPDSVSKMISPFMGGGSLEIHCASERNITVKGSDIFEPLVTFWQCLLDDPERLYERVLGHYPLSKSEFVRLQKANETQNGFEQAASFYVVNRSSFNGSTMSGGMALGHPRFTPSSMRSVRGFRCPNLSVAWMDFRDALFEEKCFAYLDPPYALQTHNHLYGQRGSTHREFPHQELFYCLKDRDDWIMSYNDCSAVKFLYAGFPKARPSWSYGMSKSRQSRELLIGSHNLRDHFDSLRKQTLGRSCQLSQAVADHEDSPRTASK